MNKGKIIVLEGLDGCGKSTQLELLSKHMSEKGSARLISFPNYESCTGRVVSEYVEFRARAKAALMQLPLFTRLTVMQASSPTGNAIMTRGRR